MRHSVLRYILVVLVFAGCATMSPPPPTDFAVLEQQLMDAMTDHKHDQLEQMISSDFTVIRVNYDANEPIRNRENWIAYTKGTNRPRYKVSDVKVKTHGHSALVHMLLEADYPPGVITPAGGALDFTVSDSWVWKDGRWQLTNRHSSLRQ